MCLEGCWTCAMVVGSFSQFLIWKCQMRCRYCINQRAKQTRVGKGGVEGGRWLFLGSAASIALIMWHDFNLPFLWGPRDDGWCSWAAFCASAWQQGMLGCGNRALSHTHTHTPLSGWSPALAAPAEAARGSRGARTNSGRGHRKWRDASTESCFHWHRDWGVCVRACECVSVFSTDRLTDCRSRWCMHDLSHSCLWKQHFWGPEESRWQEVVTSLDEQDKESAEESWHISVILTGEVSNPTI